MSINTQEIVLRPRFKFDVKQDNQYLLKLFEDTKTTQKPRKTSLISVVSCLLVIAFSQSLKC